MLLFKFITVFIFALLCVVQGVSQPIPFLSDTVTYIWPTNASKQISSTFAETRSAHLHAGIDIRTWGREGYKVFATRTGTLYRIGIGPNGYGNVIYLKHDDGSFSVYAHLNRFEKTLQAYADSIRLIDYTYELDLNLESERITYRQGDVIGYTGSTGVGPPHLHFELRTPDYRPFNPLLTNLTITDTIPPVFSALAIEYLNSETLHFQGYEIIFPDKQNGVYHFGEIELSQAAGLAVNVFDKANNTPNAYAAYSLTFVVETDTLFQSTVDQFPYSFSKHMFLDRSYPVLAATRSGFQRLYRVSGNHLPFYTLSDNGGILQFPKGRYEAQIIAEDIYGNRSIATLLMITDGNSSQKRITHIPAYPRPEISNTWPGHGYRFSKPNIPASRITPAVSGPHEPELPKFESSRKTYFSKSRFGKVLIPQRVETFSNPNQTMWIQFPSNALYDTLNLKAEIKYMDDEVHYNFSPTRLPIHESAVISMILPESISDQHKLALFSYDEFRDKHFYLPGKNKNGLLRAEIHEIADLRLIKDTTPPEVRRAKIRKNLAGKYIIEIHAEDEQTGIDYRKSEITVNGKKGITEYKPDRDKLVYYHPDFIPEAQNTISFRVFDGIGNIVSGEKSVSFNQ